MQRVLVIVSVALLATVSLGVGALAANWPFWSRAWAWHVADGGWPSELSGPRAIVHGGGSDPLRFDVAAADLARVADHAGTHALLRVRGERADAWFAPGFDASSMIDGRGLSRLLLLPLFQQLEQQHPQLLDAPVGAWLTAWRQDPRGALTARALLEQAGNDLQSPPARRPLNPFSAPARLASGGDFLRAALSVFNPDVASQGTSSAAAQLLAAVAASVEGRSYSAVLESGLWSTLAAGDALLLLDRRRGEAAAHCCMQARAADWLRVGLRVADDMPGDTTNGARNFLTPGRALSVQHPGAAVLWIGVGDPPSTLETLLAGPAGRDPETSAPQ